MLLKLTVCKGEGKLLEHEQLQILDRLPKEKCSICPQRGAIRIMKEAIGRQTLAPIKNKF